MQDAKDIESLLETVEPSRREGVRELHAMIVAESGAHPVEVRGSAIWYGPFRYRYATGREGDTGRVVLAPRKGMVSVYICEGLSGPVPGADTGVGCIRIRNLAKVDREALVREIRRAFANEPRQKAHQ